MSLGQISNAQADKTEESNDAMPKNKKSKKGSGSTEQDNENWVQCEKCLKWRLIPSVENLPEKWFCEMNVTDLERNSCDAPEQTQEEVTKKRRKNKKKTSLMLTKTKSADSLDDRGSTKVADDDKQGGEEIDGSGDPNNKVKKRGRQPKESKDDDNKVEVKGKKKGRKPKETKQQEWVQCERCEKWRRLPATVSAKDLPDTWYCNMNTWDPRSASCAVQDDFKAVEDTNHREGILSGAQKSSTGSKLTYRDLIRKPTRPISERMRASESIFSSHAAEHEGESLRPPQVMYFNSSAFQHRGGMNRINSVDSTLDEGLGLFDLMSHSQLWKNLSCRVRLDTNHNAQESCSIGMQAMVHFALGNGDGPKTADEVLFECQCGDWEGMPWTELRASCTIDSIVNCLKQLEDEGLIEKTGSSMNTLSVRYRHVVIEGIGGVANLYQRKSTAGTSDCIIESMAKPLKKRAIISS